jgi:hypothetical protein
VVVAHLPASPTVSGVDEQPSSNGVLRTPKAQSRLNIRQLSRTHHTNYIGGFKASRRVKFSFEKEAVTARRELRIGSATNPVTHLGKLSGRRYSSAAPFDCESPSTHDSKGVCVENR